MKRTLAAIMALVMALTLLPAAALAEGDLATPAGLAWDTDGTTATWKAVENAQGYYVALYSGEHSDTCGDKNKIVSQQTTDTKYNFAEELKAAGAGDYHSMWSPRRAAWPTAAKRSATRSRMRRSSP